jgi:hypothetical protein
MNDKLEDIIVRLTRSKVESTTKKRVEYRCETDGYDIMLNPDTGEVIYRFDDKYTTFATQITEKQLQYYLDTGYWK